MSGIMKRISMFEDYHTHENKIKSEMTNFVYVGNVKKTRMIKCNGSGQAQIYYNKTCDYCEYIFSDHILSFSANVIIRIAIYLYFYEMY